MQWFRYTISNVEHELKRNGVTDCQNPGNQQLLVEAAAHHQHTILTPVFSILSAFLVKDPFNPTRSQPSLHTISVAAVLSL
jgi:hypothetical protein